MQLTRLITKIARKAKMAADYLEFFKFNAEVSKSMVQQANEPKRIEGKLYTKIGYTYYLILVPYIHGTAGAPPIVEIWNHYNVGRKSFVCLLKNGIDDKCYADDYVQQLWAQWKELKEKHGKDSSECKSVVKSINNLKPKARWFSSVLVVDITDAEGKRVGEEYKTYCNGRTWWWDYPQTVQKKLMKSYTVYGSLHDLFNPVVVLATKNTKTDDKSQKQYQETDIMCVQQGKYAIKDQKMAVKIVENVKPVMESGIVTVLSNEEIKKLFTDIDRVTEEEMEYPPKGSDSQSQAPQLAVDPFAEAAVAAPPSVVTEAQVQGNPPDPVKSEDDDFEAQLRAIMEEDNQ